jgi:hypothetical protein
MNDVFAMSHYTGIFVPFNQNIEKKVLHLKVGLDIENPYEYAIAQIIFFKIPDNQHFDYVEVTHGEEKLSQEKFHDLLTKSAINFGTLCSAELNYLLSVFCPSFFIQPSEKYLNDYLQSE